VTAPAAERIEVATTRWHARASSISETVQQLARIWGTAAEAEDASHANAGDDASASPSKIKGRMRTSVLTLVVIAQRPETAERAMAIVNALASRHPSRAIVVSPGDPDGPTTFDAHIYAACHLSPTSHAEVCTEEIFIKTGGELSQHLSTAIAPLLIHDLPVVLWWPDDPPFRSRHYHDLAEMADGLLVDSGSFRDDGRLGLRGMLDTMTAGNTVHDIGWARLTLWRELLASLFDHPLLIHELPGVRHLRIDVAKPGTTMRIAKAACFAGWLAAQLGWTVSRPIQEAPHGDRLVAELLAGRRIIPVEFRPIQAGSGSNVPGTGSLMRVEMELVRGRAQTRARVTRQADHLLATADWNGAQVARRAGTLEPFEETPFLAEALDRTSGDRVFEMALGKAVELVGLSP